VVERKNDCLKYEKQKNWKLMDNNNNTGNNRGRKRKKRKKKKN